MSLLSSKKKIVLWVTSFGIAWLLLQGGWTSHSQFKIPPNIYKNSFCCISKNSELANLLRETTLLIWDKISIQYQYCFQSINKLFKDVKRDKQLFGKLSIALGSDFAQILSVVQRKTWTLTVATYIQKSNIWPQLYIPSLTHNMSLSTNKIRVFAKYLKTLPYDLCWQDQIELPLFLPQIKIMDQFCEAVFSTRKLHNSTWNDIFFWDQAILTFCNNVVADVNQKLLNKQFKKLYTYDSIDAVENNTEKKRYFPQDFLRSFIPSNLPLSTFCSKV